MMNQFTKRIGLIFIWLGLCGFSMWPFSCSHGKKNKIVFTPVGASFGSASLIDLEFLPGQGGESIVIQKNGVVSYVTSDFQPLAQTVTIGVLDEDEQGLLNVAADPDYGSNHFIYLYYTLPAGEGNQLDRLTANVDVPNGTFELLDQETIATFLKSESPGFDGHHNGGGMVFGADGDLFVGVGDGGGEASGDTTLAIAQDETKNLGKIHRIVPDRNPGEGGATIDEMYARGLRNPFTLAQAIVHTKPVVFVGDVGSTVFEEINLITAGDENFGWPLAEGDSTDAGFTNPIYGYKHTDKKFAKEDPDDSAFDVIDPQSVIVGTYYTGSQYKDVLKDRLIYSDFFQGWVRGFKLNDKDEEKSDEHLGHQSGLTSIQEGPDGFLYATSLFGSDHILRVDLVKK